MDISCVTYDMICMCWGKGKRIFSSDSTKRGEEKGISINFFPFPLTSFLVGAYIVPKRDKESFQSIESNFVPLYSN